MTDLTREDVARLRAAHSDEDIATVVSDLRTMAKDGWVVAEIAANLLADYSALLALAEAVHGAPEGVIAPYPEANDRATFLYFNGHGDVPTGTVRLLRVEG